MPQCAARGAGRSIARGTSLGAADSGEAHAEIARIDLGQDCVHRMPPSGGVMDGQQTNASDYASTRAARAEVMTGTVVADSTLATGLRWVRKPIAAWSRALKSRVATPRTAR